MDKRIGEKRSTERQAELADKKDSNRSTNGRTVKHIHGRKDG